MNITVVNYNPNWEKNYIKEQQLISQFLKNEFVECFHIGSTSVPNLKAKPIIDILLVVNDINILDNYSFYFENIGYEIMGEYGIIGRRYFRKGGDNRTHQIHAFQYDNIQEIERHLAFRDYLRQNTKISKEYGELKCKLAQIYPTDIDAYCYGKDSFVKKIEKDALKWHWCTR